MSPSSSSSSSLPFIDRIVRSDVCAEYEIFLNILLAGPGRSGQVSASSDWAHDLTIVLIILGFMYSMPLGYIGFNLNLCTCVTVCDTGKARCLNVYPAPPPPTTTMTNIRSVERTHPHTRAAPLHRLQKTPPIWLYLFNKFMTLNWHRIHSVNLRQIQFWFWFLSDCLTAMCVAVSICLSKAHISDSQSLISKRVQRMLHIFGIECVRRVRIQFTKPSDSSERTDGRRNNCVHRFHL